MDRAADIGIVRDADLARSGCSECLDAEFAIGVAIGVEAYIDRLRSASPQVDIEAILSEISKLHDGRNHDIHFLKNAVFDLGYKAGERCARLAFTRVETNRSRHRRRPALISK